MFLHPRRNETLFCLLSLSVFTGISLAQPALEKNTAEPSFSASDSGTQASSEIGEIQASGERSAQAISVPSNANGYYHPPATNPGSITVVQGGQVVNGVLTLESGQQLQLRVDGSGDTDNFYSNGAVVSGQAATDPLYYNWTGATGFSTGPYVSSTSTTWTAPGVSAPKDYTLKVEVNDSQKATTNGTVINDRPSGHPRNDDPTYTTLPVKVLPPTLIVERSMQGSQGVAWNWSPVGSDSQSVWVGQRMVLRARFANAQNFKDYSWTVNGQTFSSWTGNLPGQQNSAREVAFSNPSGTNPRNEFQVEWRWKSGGSYSATFVGKIGDKEYTRSVSFQVQRPSATLDTELSPVTWSYANGALFFGQDDPNIPGIRFKSKKQGNWPSAYITQWVQVVRGTDRRLRIMGPSGVGSANSWVRFRPNDAGGTYPWLDKDNPYGFDATVPPGYDFGESDQPVQPPAYAANNQIFRADRVAVYDQFTMWLMFQSLEQDGVWVPLKKVAWSWKGKAVRSITGTWTISVNTPQANASVEAFNFPQWQGVIDERSQTWSPSNPSTF